ncbi:MAG TPA: DUF2804 family protein [Solirubrobacteraceae bacterium]|nr:DUF2804 family protein [Solirubrobacteraceae bacterium]
MPLLRGTRPLKRWRYVAIFCEELMVCAATVQVGPARQSFWAVLLRDAQLGSQPRLLERTRLLRRRGAVELPQGGLRIDDRGRDPHGPRGRGGSGAVVCDFTLAEDAAVEVACAHGAGYVGTRNQAGVAARGTIAVDGAAPRAIEARAVIDDTAGYHARVTEWRWAAGVGVDPAGTPLAFNLVEGVNDPLDGSERAIWVAGVPHETPPVSFASDLTRIHAADGSVLRFTPEAQRERRENILLVRSEYQAPFGVFSGTLPGGLELRDGLGVVEHHRARW